MGDTGSMALGGLMAAWRSLSRTELLLVVLGGLFAVVTLSGIIQTGWFKFTRGQDGHRSTVQDGAASPPLRTDGGWKVTITIRFWIVRGLAVAFGMGLFYAEFIGHGERLDRQRFASQAIARVWQSNVEKRPLPIGRN